MPRRIREIAALAIVGACAVALCWALFGRAVRAQGPQVVVGKPGIPQTVWAQINAAGGTATVAGANDVAVTQLYLPYAVNFGNITVRVGTGDASNNYSFGIYTTTGSAICYTAAAVQASSTTTWKQACLQGQVNAGPGPVLFVMTGAAATLTIAGAGSTLMPLSTPTSSTTTTGGQLGATIAVPSAGNTLSSFAQPEVILN